MILHRAAARARPLHARLYSTQPPQTPRQAPPAPQAYKPLDPPPKQPKITISPAEPVLPPRKKSKTAALIRRFTPLRFASPDPYAAEPRDAQRGIEATIRVVRTGVLDPRYKGAAARVTAIICALPIALYLSWELWQRRFMGKEQKVRKIKTVSGEEKVVGEAEEEGS